jgi:hypothetical protein
MKQNPSSEADSRSDSQKILLPLWNPKVHCCVHKKPILDSYGVPDAFTPLQYITPTPEIPSGAFLSGFLTTTLSREFVVSPTLEY